MRARLWVYRLLAILGKVTIIAAIILSLLIAISGYAGPEPVNKGDGVALY